MLELGEEKYSAPSEFNQADAIKALYERGRVDLSLVGRKGFTPLHVAVEFGAKEVAKELIRLGTRQDVKSKSGVTPIILAVALNKPTMISLLLHKSLFEVKVELSDGAMAGVMYVAVSNGYTAVILLLYHGYIWHQKLVKYGREQESALDTAKRLRQREVEKMLTAIEAECRRDREGKVDAWDVARAIRSLGLRRYG